MTSNQIGSGGDDHLFEDWANVQVNAAVTLNQDGGGGNDSLIALLMPAVQSGGAFSALFDGGGGNDSLIGLLLPAVQSGGLVDIAFLGGAGNDFIDVSVDLSGFTPESGRLNVAVDSGEGSDHMTFLVRGTDRPMDNALFTLDGGPGEDFAVISALVHAKNCERVEIV